MMKTSLCEVISVAVRPKLDIEYDVIEFFQAGI